MRKACLHLCFPLLSLWKWSTYMIECQTVDMIFLLKNLNNWVLEAVSRKPRNLLGPEKPFLVNRYFKTERCIRLKLLVWREPLLMFRRFAILLRLKFRLRNHFGTFEKGAPAHIVTISTVSNLEVWRAGFLYIFNTLTR